MSRTFKHRGFVVHEKPYGDRLGFLPTTYFVCLSPDDVIMRMGTGRTADEAVQDMLGKQERRAA